MRRAWNKGLTKETDSRIAKYAKKVALSQKLHPHPPKFTEETRQKIREKRLAFWRSAEGQQMRLLYSQRSPWNKGLKYHNKKKNSRPPWNKGKTKKTDIRVAKNGRKISESMRLHYSKKTIEEVGAFYGLELVIRTASLRDHKFSRLVLIEKVEMWSYIENTGLKEHPCSSPKYNGDKFKIIEPILENC